MSAAQNSYPKRRKAYFAELDQQREEVRRTKEQLISEAEELQHSTDWGPTARAYRDLMQRWKAGGRADRASEDKMWARLKADQDTFFDARNAVFTERDAELRVNSEVKEKILYGSRADITVIS